MLDNTLLTLLRQVDTPTICNAIERVEGRRGFARFTRGTMIWQGPKQAMVGFAMVGFAMTACIAAQAPPDEPADIIRARRMAYYKAMYEAPKPSLAVIEDLDRPHCIGAYWGEVNTAIHKGFGMAGALTNGVVRDLGDLAPDFPVLAGSIGPSHGHVHVRSIGKPVNIMGLDICAGDLVHADCHGAAVIPPGAIALLGDAIRQLWRSEQIILDAARKADFDFDAFETAWQAFEKARI